MKSLNRIVNAVYNEKWLITPQMHESIRKQLENHLQGNLPLPTGDEDQAEDDEQNIYVKDDGGIAVIEIDGVIGKHLSLLETQCGGVDVDQISWALDEAANDPEIGTIAIYFNTPGGTVTGVPELAEKIAEIAQVKDVIGFTDTLCASAGYWLASHCTAFYCSPSSQVGSIGVYSMVIDESVALANAGLKVNAFSAGKYKLLGASFQPMTDEEKGICQEEINVIYQQFKSAILSKRDVKDEDMQGQVFDGNDAVEANLADGTLNNFPDFITFLSQPDIYSEEN